MTKSGCFCCICVKKSPNLKSLSVSDRDEVKYCDKLKTCVPNEVWEETYFICDNCVPQLAAAYSFVLICVKNESLRRENLDQLKSELESQDASNLEEQFYCDHCGKSFTQKRSLSIHITRLHIRRKPPKKEDEVYIKAEDIKEELKVEQGKEESDNDEDNVMDYSTDDEKPVSKKKGPKVKDPMKCEYCGALFQKRQLWSNHIRSKHTFEKPFSCDQCDSRYMNAYSLLIHKRRHNNEKPFICASCGKSFVSSADLNHHSKIHDLNRAYPCSQCDRSFKTHSNLRTHRLQMHLDPSDWKYHCTVCDKKFPIKGNLVKHIKRHSGIKNFSCHVCDKRFINKAELTLHLNSHTNERTVKCNLCSKEYKNREGLRRHMKVVHDLGNWKAPVVEKKFLCPMCPKTFAFSNKLQRHIFTHTGQKPYKCEYCAKRFIDNYGRKVHLKKDHNVEFP